jgi:pimeloyl-ACP methyl ester carboxylesterase
MLCETIICVDRHRDRSVPAMTSERLIVLDGDGEPDDAEAFGLERYALCGTAAGATAAAWRAIEEPERVSALILVAPEPPDATLCAHLEALDVPTMVICGTHDGLATSEAGRVYKRLVARCDLVYVYAAHDVAADRPEAFAALVSDFVARSEGHVVRLESRVLYA